MGMPQIEVTFDIDANGIISISAKDKATGKEQNITIENQSGLSENDIQQMVDDAEAAAAEDQEKFEKIESRNKLDTLMYQSQKLLNDNEDKLSDMAKDSIGVAVENAQTALDAGTGLSDAFDNLQQTLHNISEELYSASSSSDDTAEHANNEEKEEDIIDADFEEA